MKNERKSNIELLRIILMFMILALHANVLSLDFPSVKECIEYPLQSFMRYFNEYLCLGAVNTYVLISGWFGINYKTKGLCNFLFQCLFFSISIFTIFAILGEIELTRINILSSLLLYKNAYWFVWSYLILYIFSPVLNDFIQNTKKQTYEKVLIGLFLAQTVIYIFTRCGFYQAGYHPLSFIALYLLARYFRIYGQIPNKYIAISGYFACALINTLLNFLPIYIQNKPTSFTGILFSYTNPLNIAGPLFLLFFFVQLEIKNRVINQVAVSCFAVYLFHCHFCILEHYKSLCLTIFNKYGGVIYLVYILLFMCLVFAIAIIIDKVRIITFNHIWQFIEKRKNVTR